MGKWNYSLRLAGVPDVQMAGVEVEVREGGEETVSAPAQVLLKRGPQ
jgi:hypothetical protein